MAEIGRRQEVQDPLALNPLRRDTERALPTYGVRNPHQTGGDAATRQGLSGLNVIDGLQAVAGRIFQAAAENSMTEGKLEYMKGTTEAEIEARGDKYATRGWQSLNSVNTANDWFMKEAQFIQEEGNRLSPDEYQARLMDSRNEALKNIPENDKDARAMWAAAFEDHGPRLQRLQTEQHNEYNRGRSMAELSNALATGSQLNTDASVRVGSGSFRVSQEPVRTPLVGQTEADRDFGIRTLLGEAAGEGQQGMAAVAHVVMNRMGSKRFGYKTVKDAVLADKQFSTWNTGEGGNNPSKWDPNSAQYKRAAEVWDAVSSGHHVDPTGGSTHYYSPKGMKGGAEPQWWKEEAKNGAVRIGSHMFAVQGRPGNGPKGTLNFRHKGQESIDGNFKSILEETAAEFGGTLNITSGYRSESHPVEAGKIARGGKAGEHSHKTAADIDMTGMSDRDRAALVDSLRGKGAMRFGIYKNSPDMLHVDMKDQTGDGSAWFMYDRSKDNLGKAPHWFQEMAATDTGGTHTQRRGTQVQALIDSSNLKPADKASVVADALRRSLDSGDDGVFNDIGGVSYLYGLGASASDIDSVLKAKDRFDNEQDKKFDLTKERARSDLLAAVQSGELADEGAVGAAIEDLLASEQMSDSEAKSLYRSVTEDMRKGGNKVLPIEFRGLALDLYEKIDGGDLTPEEAAAQIEAFGKENKIDPAQINTFMGNMFGKAESRRQRLRNEADTALKKRQKQEATMEEVDQALVSGSGLATVSGTVTIPNDQGKDVDVPAKEYGIYKLKQEADKAKEQFMASSIKPGMSQSQIEAVQDAAERQFYEQVYEPLRKQGVVDEKFGNWIGSAVSGTILGPDKQITEDSQKAVDAYFQLRDNPRIGEAYAASMIKDPQARSFLETTYQMMDGRGDLGQAMLRANTILSQKLEPADKISNDAIFQSVARPKIKDAINNQLGSEWFKIGFGLPGVNWTNSERQIIAGRNTPVLEGAVLQKANRYRMENPREPMDVSIKKAVQDVENSTVVVGTDVLMGDPSKGQRLDQRMGLEGMEAGRKAPHMAVESYLEEVISKDPKFSALYNERVGHGLFPAEKDQKRRGMFREKNMPAYGVTYSPIDDSIGITIYEDSTRTTQVGETFYEDAGKLGKWYKQRINEGQPNFLQKAWRYGVDTIANVGQADGSNAFARSLAEQNDIPLE